MPTKRGLTFEGNRGETSIQPTLASARIHIGENSSSYIDYKLVYKFADVPFSVPTDLTSEEKLYLQEQPETQIPTGISKLRYKAASEGHDFYDFEITWVVGNTPYEGELKEVPGKFGKIGFEDEKEVENNQPFQLVIINAKKELFCTSLGPKVKAIDDYVVKNSNGDETNVEAPSEDKGHIIRFEVKLYVNFIRDCLLEFESVCTFKNWIKNKLRVGFAPYNGIEPQVELKYANGEETTSQPFKSLNIESDNESNDDSNLLEKETTYPAVYEIRFEVPSMKLIISERKKHSSDVIQRHTKNPLSIDVELNNENELLITTYRMKFEVDPGCSRLSQLHKDNCSLKADFYHRVDYQKLFRIEVKYKYRCGEPVTEYPAGGQYVSFGSGQFFKIKLGDVVTKRVMDTIDLKLSYISSLKLSLRNDGWDQVRNENAKQFWFRHYLNGLEPTIGIESLKSLYTFNHSTNSSSALSAYFHEKDYRCFLVKEGQNSGLLYQYVLLHFNSEFVRPENRQRVFEFNPETKNCIEIHFIFENTKDMKAVINRGTTEHPDELNLFYGTDTDKEIGKNYETNRRRKGGGSTYWYYDTINKTIEDCMKSYVGINDEMYFGDGYTYGLHANKSVLCKDADELDDKLKFSFEDILETNESEDDNYAYDSKFTEQVLTGILEKINSRELKNSRREIIIISRPHKFIESVEKAYLDNPKIRIQHLFVGLGVKNSDPISKDYGKNDVKCISHGDLERRLQRVMQIAFDPSQREFLKVRKFSAIKQTLDQHTMKCSLQSHGSLYWSEKGSSFVDAYERKLLYVWVSKQKITLPVKRFSKIKLELTCHLENQKFKNAEPFSAEVPIDLQADVTTIDSTNRHQHHHYLECLRKIDQENLYEEQPKQLTGNHKTNQVYLKTGSGRQESTKSFCKKRLFELKKYITITGNVRTEDVPDDLLETIPPFKKYKNQLRRPDAITRAFCDHFKDLYGQNIQLTSQANQENLNEHAPLLQRMERQISKSEY